ncbi:DUF4180 domain-containing protein [Sphingobacterium alkalisoli]|uniref:DUF4180 domain-containing protein n=1 Tax=Sphingobacterium alkalisoli TaxID=1874115 RepID=A0A4V5LXW3_9SPHI|nr:DUF4180 domain-containing protein [Sphingobacterium alkalisoli]TJY64189.1 DUF4180 domain-containing protein [Sphingobacterium alkalisoli]GGH23281.1 hypothetical protein GCM10011418_30410 [Sphingobacterium alkalisoli]
MQLIAHRIANKNIAELIISKEIFTTLEDATDLMGDVYYQGFDKLIVYQKNINPSFFDLKTKLAGEILQKFATYKLQLAIVGDFNFDSKSLTDFIYESNKGNLINFKSTLQLALN